MRILTYRDLRPGRFSKALDRLRVAISQGNFAAAGLKKLSPTNYWRAKLSDEARLLLTFQPYNGETVCLFLEVIADHAYEKSRFLRGATVDRDKIEAEPLPLNKRTNLYEPILVTRQHTNTNLEVWLRDFKRARLLASPSMRP